MTQINQICHRRGKNLTAVLVSHQLYRFPFSPWRHSWATQEPVCICLPPFCLCFHNPRYIRWSNAIYSLALFCCVSPLSHILFHCRCAIQMEELIARMQEEKNGIPIRTVKSFLTKIPSVFSGKTFLLCPMENGKPHPSAEIYWSCQFCLVFCLCTTTVPKRQEAVQPQYFCLFFFFGYSWSNITSVKLFSRTCHQSSSEINNSFILPYFPP